MSKEGPYIVKFKVFGKGFKTTIHATSAKEAENKLASVIAKNTEIVDTEITPEDYAKIDEMLRTIFGFAK